MTQEETAVAAINDYFAKNNSIGVMDSLLINRQIIKSGMGYDTTKQPTTADRYDTVNSIGSISNVTGKAITMKAQRGFDIPGDPIIGINSEKALHVGRYYYQNADGSEKPLISQIYEQVNSNGNNSSVSLLNFPGLM